MSIGAGETSDGTSMNTNMSLIMNRTKNTRKMRNHPEDATFNVSHIHAQHAHHPHHTDRVPHVRLINHPRAHPTHAHFVLNRTSVAPGLLCLRAVPLASLW